MADWLWDAVLGVNLGSTVACWDTICWYWRRRREGEHARMRDVQAACPVCGCASAEDVSDPN